MSFYCILLILTISPALKVNANAKCSIDLPARSPKYYLLEKCYRSKLGIVDKVNYTSLANCQKFGIEKKGLALNFSPFEARSEGVEYTCEVLKCAEADGGLSLINDTRYDYYSIYAKPIPHVNSTCVPGIGMFFLITKKQNYTQGARECRNMSSAPGDIMSEQRTDALALLLAGAGVEAAFVGLRSKNGSAFIGGNGDTLDCINYRAWDPGHPRRDRSKYDCVLITRYRTWRSYPCKKRYPMLCELVPEGPYKRGEIFASRNRANATEAETPSYDNE